MTTNDPLQSSLGLNFTNIVETDVVVPAAHEKTVALEQRGLRGKVEQAVHGLFGRHTTAAKEASPIPG